MTDPRHNTRACPYCGLEDHTGREHFQFVMSLSDEAVSSDDEPTV